MESFFGEIVIGVKLAVKGLICCKGFGKFSLRLIWPQTDLCTERPNHWVQNQNSQPGGKYETREMLLLELMAVPNAALIQATAAPSFPFITSVTGVNGKGC